MQISLLFRFPFSIVSLFQTHCQSRQAATLYLHPVRNKYLIQLKMTTDPLRSTIRGEVSCAASTEPAIQSTAESKIIPTSGKHRWGQADVRPDEVV